jgi:phage shock protein C
MYPEIEEGIKMSDPYRKLYRSRSDRMISGVCGGLADYFKIDATIVRLLFVAFALAGGPGFVAYLIMLIVVPEEPMTSSAANVVEVAAVSEDSESEDTSESE